MHPEELPEVRRLAQEGLSIRAIARKLGRDVKTIRRALGRPRKETPASSKLDPFHPAIQKRVELGLTVPRILREIRELGYTGGRTILAQHVRNLRGPQKKERRVFRRFETPPGVESQVDWSPFRVSIAGQERRVHCFSMIQAYSRMLFVAFHRDERLPTLLHAHVEAFSYFQGLTQRLVYDNMTTVTLGRRGGRPLWNPAFLGFCRHYGFQPHACRPRDPNRKGKIERPFPYIDSDFLRGRTFASWDDLNGEARRWLDAVANARKHETTKRVPFEMHGEERPMLIALPEAAFPTAREEVRKVGRDGYVLIDGTFYPAPARLVGQYVPIRIHPHRVEILDASREVAASHAVPDIPCRLPSDWGPPTRGEEPLSRTRLETRFLTLFPQALAFLEGLQDRMKALTSVHLRQLERLVELYGERRAQAAVARAMKYRNFNAQAVARILEKDYPDVFPDPPVFPLTAGPAVLGALDDIETGTLQHYRFDSMPPTAPPQPGDQAQGDPSDERDPEEPS